jgi:HAD superfamily hydrolase (TIGR01509 family)
MVTPVKNIIFDLGGVLLNLNYQLTRKAFENLGVLNFDAFYTQHAANPLFENLEVGAIEPEAFYEALREATGLTLSNDQLETAWNAMLLDFPIERLLWLDQIKNKYNIYLFSNTNAIHYKAFTTIYAQTAPLIGLNTDFNHFFKEAHYSHTLGQRKPEVAAFEAVLAKSGLDPSQTLFIDDTISNIEGAQKAGLRTLFLSGGLTVQDVGL